MSNNITTILSDGSELKENCVSECRSTTKHGNDAIVILNDKIVRYEYIRQKLRPIFIINELNGKKNLICVASGIMIGCRYNGVIFWLFQRKIRKNIGNYHIYEDFGGGINASDGNILNTIYREASEETNNILSADILDEIYDIGEITPVYVETSKYLLSFVVFDYADASDKLHILFNIRQQTSPIYIEHGATLNWLCQIPLKLLNPRIQCITNFSN